MASLWLAAYARLIVHARSDRGAVATEYALLIALIALAMVGAAMALGAAVSDRLDSIATGLDSAGAP